MSEEQLQRIKNYTKTINETIEDEDLLDYVAKEVVDRVLIYLNTETLDEKLERIVSRIVSGIFNQTNSTISTADPDTLITGMSDNGQSITFSNEVRNYLNTTEDNELFAGFSKLLARFRGINVVS